MDGVIFVNYMNSVHIFLILSIIYYFTVIILLIPHIYIIAFVKAKLALGLTMYQYFIHQDVKN